MTVFTTFRWRLLFALLAAQTGDLDSDFDQERRAVYGPRYTSLLATVIARYADGSPVRDYIYCDGLWYRYADEPDPQIGLSLPFRTDSRGAIVMNPGLTDETLTCHCTVGILSGHVTLDLTLPPPHIGVLIVR